MPAIDIAGEHQQQDHCTNHDLVGNRIKKHAQFRNGTLRPRQIAVEIIGDPHQAVERESKPVIDRQRLHALRLGTRPQQEHKDRYRKDA